jgi:hypothetical protein
MKEILDSFNDLPHLRVAVAAFKLIGDDAVLNSGDVGLFEKQIRGDYRMNDHYSTRKEFIQNVCRIRFDRDCASRSWENIVAALPAAAAELLKDNHPMRCKKVKVDAKHYEVRKKKVGRQSMAEADVIAKALEFTLVDEGFSIATGEEFDVYVGFITQPSLSESVEVECANNAASIAIAEKLCKFFEAEGVGVTPQVQDKSVELFKVVPALECNAEEAYVAVTVPISSNKNKQCDKRDAVIRAVKNTILAKFEA